MSEILRPIAEMSPTEAHYIGSMRRLHTLVEQRYGDTAPIVDHDYGPPQTPELADAAPDDLEDFPSHIDNLISGIEGHEPADRAMRRNLESTRMVLDVLTGRTVIGRDITYPDYVEAVMGVPPGLVPETGGPESIQGQYEQLEWTIAKLGYRFDLRDRDAFYAAFGIAPGAMETTIKELVPSSRQHIAAQLGPTLTSSLDSVDIKVENMAPHTWQAYFGTEDIGQFFMLFNSNPLIQLTALEAREGADHEFTHATSSSYKQQLIAQGDLSASSSFLAAFSPSYFQEEVAARAMETTPAENNDELSVLLTTLAQGMTKYRVDVANNMIFKANTGMATTEVAQYGEKWLKFDDPGKTRESAQFFADPKNLLYKTIFAVDTTALRLGRQISALSPEEKRLAVTRLISGPMTTSEIFDLVQPEQKPIAA